MQFIELPLKSIEMKPGLVRFATPLTIEPKVVKLLAQDFFHLFKEKICPNARALGEPKRDANADTYPIYLVNREVSYLNFVHDIDETRLSFETKRKNLTEPLFRLLREQRIIKPDLEYIRERVFGTLQEIVAALLWQVGAIKVSLGDLAPFFKVDERRNRSPIYIDVKCLPNYQGSLTS